MPSYEGNASHATRAIKMHGKSRLVEHSNICSFKMLVDEEVQSEKAKNNILSFEWQVDYALESEHPLDKPLVSNYAIPNAQQGVDHVSRPKVDPRAIVEGRWPTAQDLENYTIPNAQQGVDRMSQPRVNPRPIVKGRWPTAQDSENCTIPNAQQGVDLMFRPKVNPRPIVEGRWSNVHDSERSESSQRTICPSHKILLSSDMSTSEHSNISSYEGHVNHTTQAKKPLDKPRVLPLDYAFPSQNPLDKLRLAIQRVKPHYKPQLEDHEIQSPKEKYLSIPSFEERVDKLINSPKKQRVDKKIKSEEGECSKNIRGNKEPLDDTSWSDPYSPAQPILVIFAG